MTATQQVPGTDSVVTALLPLVNKRLILEDGTPQKEVMGRGGARGLGSPQTSIRVVGKVWGH